jgi:hypothetical protein
MKELLDRAVTAAAILAAVAVLLVVTFRLLRPLLPYLFVLVVVGASMSYLLRGPHSRR